MAQGRLPRYERLADPGSTSGAAFAASAPVASGSGNWSTVLLVLLRLPLSLLALLNLSLGYVVWLPLRAGVAAMTFVWKLASVIFVAWSVTADEFQVFASQLCCPSR